MTIYLSLEGKVGLVTGAGQGIGRSCALKFAEAGANVFIADIDEKLMRRTIAEVKERGRKAAGVVADVREAKDVARMIDACLKELGGLDVTANVLGGTGGQFTRPFLELTDDYWDFIVNRNLRATYLCCAAEAKVMVEGKKGGSIVNVSSIASIGAAPRLAPYGAAKAGIESLTRTMALELARHGIRVNAICPGTTASPTILNRFTPEILKRNEELIPLGHLAHPDDQANAVAFLASDLAKHVTGHTLIVDGGQWLSREAAYR